MSSTRGYVIPGFPSPGRPDDAGIVIFGYRPSLAFAIVAIVTFSILAIVHTLLAARYKVRWWAMVILGSVFEVVGYVMRAFAYYYPYRVVYFVVQYFFLVVSPVLFSASIYACLSILTPGRWILATFVTLDVITTIIQIAGAAGIGSAESNQQNPTKFNNVLIGGLAVQLFSSLVFLIIFILFLAGWAASVRFQFPTTDREANTRQLFILFAATLLILTRTTFRLAEAADGVLGPATSSQPLFAMLDYFPVFLALTLLAFGHPGGYGRKLEPGIHLTDHVSQKHASHCNNTRAL